MFPPRPRHPRRPSAPPEAAPSATEETAEARPFAPEAAPSATEEAAEAKCEPLWQREALPGSPRKPRPGPCGGRPGPRPSLAVLRSTAEAGRLAVATGVLLGDGCKTKPDNDGYMTINLIVPSVGGFVL